MHYVGGRPLLNSAKSFQNQKKIVMNKSLTQKYNRGIEKLERLEAVREFYKPDSHRYLELTLQINNQKKLNREIDQQRWADVIPTAFYLKYFGK